MPKNTKGKEKINKKQKKKKIKNDSSNKFSFENEIIIGVTKKEEPKIEKKKSKKKKKQNKNKIQLEKNLKQKSNSRNKSILQEERQIKGKGIFRIIKYGMLGVLIIVGIIYAMYSPLFYIKEIQVEGNNIVTKNEIISLSQIQIDQNTFELSKDEIRKQIKEDPYIESVNITRKLPSTIILKVQERKPAYLLEYAASYIYLDKQGYLLEINTQKLELPILQGAATETSEFVVGNRLCREDLERLSMVLKVVEVAKANELSDLITRIDISDKNNLKLLFETKDKIAYLGDSTNLNTKILSIKVILEKTEGISGEIFVNMDLNNENPMFRERV